MMALTRREERFAEFFGTHVALVRGFVRSLGHRIDVEDVVERTFITAWQRFESIAPHTTRPWLLGVARNHVRNAVRSQQRHERLASAVAAAGPVTAEEMFAHDLDPGEAQWIQAALVRLPAADREVLTLAAWHQMEPREIAKVLSISPAAVRTRLSRARERFVALTMAESTEHDQ